MERYTMYLRKSRFDRDYAELSIEETLKRHKAISPLSYVVLPKSGNAVVVAAFRKGTCCQACFQENRR